MTASSETTSERTAVTDQSAPAEPTRSRRHPLRSLRVRNYRLYFFGQLISLTGTWAQQVAQDWLNEHPKWMLSRWRCEQNVPRQLPS